MVFYSRNNLISSFLVPAGVYRCELVFLNSRFIASAAPAFSIEEARIFIAQAHSLYPDATHHVPAYLIGFGSSVISHCSDDGEPSGTAGRPVLAVLSGSGLGDVVVVVTRYFGGTKLGTGGLVRAYSESARQVLSGLPRARKILSVTCTITLPYHWFEKVRSLIISFQGRITEQDFGSQITLSAQVPADLFDDFQHHLSNLTHGSLHAVQIYVGELIVPLEENSA